MSVRMRAVHTGRMSVKLDNGDLYENLQRKFQIWLNSNKKSYIWRENLSVFHIVGNDIRT
jgi:hypothetical protein